MGNIFSRRNFFHVSAAMGSALYSFSAGTLPAFARARLRSVPPSPPESEEEEEIPTSIYEKRIATVQGELAKQDYGALVISSVGAPSGPGGESIYWAKHASGVVVIPAVGIPTLIASGPPPPRPAIVDTWIADLRIGRGPDNLLDMAADRLKELKLERGKIAVGGANVWAARPRLETALPGARFDSKGNEIQDQVRLIKDEYELKYLRWAGKIADAELRAAQAFVAPGRTTYDILAETYHVSRAMRADWSSSRDIPGYSPSPEKPLNILGGNPAHRLRVGDCFGIEPLIWYKNYNVETSLTFAIGKVPAEQKDIAQLSFDSFQAAADALKPGVPVVNAWKQSKAVCNPKGYPDQTNGIGHFIGIANIERPPIENDPGVVLKPGMVVSLHGNLISPNKYKAIMGCCFIITEKGKEALTDLKMEPLAEAWG